MTRPFSLPYKQKIVERLVGANAVSARQISRETGIPQETISRWLRDARSLPVMPKKPPVERLKQWTVDEKIRVLSESAKLSGTELTSMLEREELALVELEQWRLALGEGGGAGAASRYRMKKLERELARKEKALAEAAALLVLKKKVEHLWEDEDDDTGENNET